MRSLSYARLLTVVLMAFVLGAVVVGCGGDDDGSETNPGAPAGATGDAAGGAAVEAGKQRTEKEIQDEKKNFSTEPPPVSLQQGERSGYNVSKPTIVIARSQSELNSLKKKLKAKGVSTEIAPVDFKTRQAVAVVFPKLPPGTLTQISDIHEEDGKIVVTAVRVEPGKGCPTGKSTNPFSIVETRTMKGTPTLKIQKVNNSPCT
ncbi:MAG: hypothetical protein JHC98_10315 [Thermoleophilaceae bacterium]|nr:hypothetical protein [Thermoleophilaceae bacterium]